MGIWVHQRITVCAAGGIEAEAILPWWVGCQGARGELFGLAGVLHTALQSRARGCAVRLSIDQISLADLLASFGEGITKIHSRPSPKGCVMCGTYRGKVDTLANIRAELEDRYLARETRKGGAK